MTPNALKQGKFGSLGAIFLFIFLPCMWGLGLQKEFPVKWPRGLFRPMRAPSRKERSRQGRDQDGLGWTPPQDLDGPKTLEKKTHGEFGQDAFGSGMGSGRTRDRTQVRVWKAPLRSLITAKR